MTPRDLIAAFDVLADAPDGVNRLRELVRSLAVRGKLVGRDPTEGLPALADVTAARVAAGTLNASAAKKVAILPAADHPYTVSSHWQMVRFGDAFLDVFTGPFGSSLKASQYVSNGFPVVNPQNMQDGRIVPLMEKCVDSATRSRLSSFILKAGDLIVARRGEMGRCAVVGPDEDGWLCGTGSLVLRPTAHVEPRFAAIFLASPWTVERLGGDSVGSTMKNLNQRIMKELPFGLPPLAEQHRIVARVDELMGLLDRLEAARATRDAVRRAARDAALANLRDAPDAKAVEAAWGRIARQMDDLFAAPEDVAPLRQAVLQLAVRGRLVPADCAEVGLSDLLREPLSNGRSVPTGQGYPVLRLTALRGQSVDSQHCKNGSWSAEDGRRFRIEKGDLLVVRGNGSKDLVARGCMVLETEEVAFPDTAIRLRPDLDRVSQKYLFYAWEASSTRAVLEEKAKTTAGIWKVSQADLYGVALPIPDQAAQQRIVAKLDAFMALCDDLEARLTTTKDLHGQFAAAAVHHLDA